jgi:hypothetical protein
MWGWMAKGTWIIWIAAMIGFGVLWATGNESWIGFLGLPTFLVLYFLDKRWSA